MTGNAEELELKDRLNLIETMIAEGRRTTESWGWTFVLWGVAYYIAIAWAILGKPSFVGLARDHDRRWRSDGAYVPRAMRASKPRRPRLAAPSTAIWIAMGSFHVIALHVSWHRAAGSDLHIFVAIIAADARHSQCRLQHDSQVEGAICLRAGLVGGSCDRLLWLR